ncbi:MAG TPA: thiamine pyrophosphate-dependent enzyme [Polyangia bacterium]|jgi:pyruvate dehydrogenase (quinone)|nr:thiamine pyrophosphate-dependent enzyme [Polyangia bacterium]
MSRNTSDLLIERLIDWGVDTVFGLPGDGINGIFEALRTHQDAIRFVQVRHEETAAFAACGYAKYTGRLGVCLATSGPGGIHLLNGLYDAKLDNQPVLAITGHTFHDLIGAHYQQDVDLDKLFTDVAVFNERIMGPAHVVNMVDTAIKHAVGHRGVAHLTIPKDIQEWTASDDKRSPANVPQHNGGGNGLVQPLPSDEALRRAAEILNHGTRVAVLAGRGCLGASEELTALADRLAAPVAKALLGKAALPDDSPFCTGGIGLLGTAPSAEAMKECDTLLLAGTNFPYIEFLPAPKQARTIQIDIDPARIGSRHPVEVGLVGDCRRILAQLVSRLQRKDDRAFLTKTQQRMKDWNNLMDLRASRDSLPMKPQVPVAMLDRFLTDDAIIAADCGTVTTWAARHLRMRGSMMFSASGTLATMANGVPYAIAAAVAHPGRQVVAVVGDGGLTMLMGELATIAKYKLPIKILVIKNNSLGEIKWEQLVMEGNPTFGVDLQPIDFAAVADACGVRGYRLDKPGDAMAVIGAAMAEEGPALIEATVDPNEPPMPGQITSSQALTFAKALARGEKGRFTIIKDLMADRIREVV